MSKDLTSFCFQQECSVISFSSEDPRLGLGRSKVEVEELSLSLMRHLMISAVRRAAELVVLRRIYVRTLIEPIRFRAWTNPFNYALAPCGCALFWKYANMLTLTKPGYIM